MQIDGQINFVEQIEQKDRDSKYCKAVRERYKEWLDTPGDLIIRGDDQRRKTMQRYANQTHYDVFSGCLHICDSLPDDCYIWINAGASQAEYWVLSKKGEVVGKHIEKCPYCGANLKAGEGDIKLIKADAKRHNKSSHYNYYRLWEIDGSARGGTT